MFRFLQNSLGQLLPEALQTGGPVVVALLILIVSWYGGKALARATRPGLVAHLQRVSVAETILGVLRAVVMVFALFTVANVFGYEPENILLSVTVLTAAIAYILAPLLGSLINGLFVLVNRPYEVGDMIELEDTDQLGYVREITLRYTKVHTLENTTLVIPNDSIHRRDVINYSEDDERSWLSVELTVTYESDLEAACDRLEAAGRSVDELVDGGPAIRMGGQKYPAAPTAFVTAFGDHGVAIELRFWVFEPYHPTRVRSKVFRRIQEELAETEIALAYPRTHHVFDETSGRAAVSLTDEEPWAGQSGRSEHRSR
ncbi:MAG: mechanosensitive ion channel family protein [Euryarchaeota archaeon]|nr:mechanosensitive ion channel family protein [Euryarchaeota archaeon]